MGVDGEILRVDCLDHVLGTIEKTEAHTSPVLHRAFSVFLHHDETMLLQRRHPNKYHSGGLWTNACCSHQTAGFDLQSSVAQRMMEELGITCNVTEVFSFVYFYQFAVDLFEYEYDHVFVGDYSGSITLNCEEACESGWFSFDALLEDVRVYPQKYTVWFITALPQVISSIRRGIT